MWLVRASAQRTPYPTLPYPRSCSLAQRMEPPQQIGGIERADGLQTGCSRDYKEPVFTYQRSTSAGQRATIPTDLQAAAGGASKGRRHGAAIHRQRREREGKNGKEQRRRGGAVMEEKESKVAKCRVQHRFQPLGGMASSTLACLGRRFQGTPMQCQLRSTSRVDDCSALTGASAALEHRVFHPL